jgi:hypothetical protein
MIAVNLRRALQPSALIGFAVAATFAVLGGWSLPEFCWSAWLTGLIYSWAAVLTGAIRIIATGRSRKSSYEEHLPVLGRMSGTAFLLALVLVIVPGAVAMAYLYAIVFGFYGLFLSFFAEMQPHDLFGRNGFINSDFSDPVMYLLVLFWPMVAGTLITFRDELVRGDPWRRLLLPTREVARVHVLVVTMPFLALLAWALFGESYHSVTIVLLMGLFYLWPWDRSGAASTVGAARNPADPVGVGG